MSRASPMRRRAGALLGVSALALAGCSSGGGTVYERMGPIVEEQIFGGPILGEDRPEPAPREMSRAELNRIPYATISLSLGDNPRAFVVPIADNGGYLVYQDRAERGIVMHGGLITATHGFGYNLDSVAHRPDDPVFAPTPLAEWPASTARSYAFMLRGQIAYDIAVVCAFERGAREVIEIAELRFEVVRVVETCVNPARRFTNTYWVAPETGFIWKSVQWVGPRIPAMTVEIVRPYATG